MIKILSGVVIGTHLHTCWKKVVVAGVRRADSAVGECICGEFEMIHLDTMHICCFIFNKRERPEIDTFTLAFENIKNKTCRYRLKRYSVAFLSLKLQEERVRLLIPLPCCTLLCRHQSCSCAAKCLSGQVGTYFPLQCECSSHHRPSLSHSAAIWPR